MRILSALLCMAVCGAPAVSVSAQSALAAADVDASRLPEPLLTLRPAAGLGELAREVAGVLELRTGQRVEVGSAPPPHVLEAVPAGHIALALRDGSLLLVLGAPGGRSVETAVDLQAEDPATRARAVALGVETLRDEATDLSRRPPPPADEPPAVEPSESSPARPAARGPRPEDRAPDEPASSDDLLTDVEPLLYLRAFTGVSSASASLMGGLGAGLGLCVRHQCLFLSGEVPIQLGTPGRTDARYRYTTFLSGFYSRPLRFGDFTPGATLAFFTRVGEFDQDMGLGDRGIQTDLGARGSLELSWELVEGLDLMTEGGVDLTIDRLRLASGNTLTNRADRWAPWAQLALRYRP